MLYLIIQSKQRLHLSLLYIKVLATFASDKGYTLTLCILLIVGITPYILLYMHVLDLLMMDGVGAPINKYRTPSNR